MDAFLPLHKFLLLLLLLSVPRLGLCEEDVDQEDEELNGTVIDAIEEAIGLKYMIIWDKHSLSAKRSSSWEDFNPDIESVNCTSDLNCTVALYDLDVALSYDSDIPSAPYCILPRSSNESTGVESEEGRCTCGPDRCVSYSRQYSNGRAFYYCGPCGWVGAQCSDYRCTHHLAECRKGYCECIKDGVYYDLAFCYIPFYGQRMVVEMLIVTAIIVICCAILAYLYTRLGRRRADRYLERWARGSTTQEPPTDDTPPTYDDVVEDKLPSYQDALQMSNKNDDGEEGGINNLGFEPDHSLPPPPAYKDLATATTPDTNPQETDSNKPSTASFPAPTPHAWPDSTSINIPPFSTPTVTLTTSTENETPTNPPKTAESLKKSAATEEVFDTPEGDAKGPQNSSSNRLEPQPLLQPLHAELSQVNQAAEALDSKM